MIKRILIPENHPCMRRAQIERPGTPIAPMISFGRRRPVANCPHLSLRNYLGSKLPAPPGSCSYISAAAAVLSLIYDNDYLGCCVISGGYHEVGVATGNAGKLFTATDDQIIGDYGAIGGYVPGDPNTDNGCDEQTAMNYWTQHGFADGTKLLGWLEVDATNKTEVMQAMFLFENLFFGLELPDAWINPFPSNNGFVWDVAGDPDPDNGHCIVGVGYSGPGIARTRIVGVNAEGVQIDTWGMIGTITWAALAAYVVPSAGGMLYTWLSPDQLAKGQQNAPNGVGWRDLCLDFNSLGGNVVVPPAPPPVPPVPPVPTEPTGATCTAAPKGCDAGTGPGLGDCRCRTGAKVHAEGDCRTRRSSWFSYQVA